MSKVGIIMGSTSDMPVMEKAIDILKGFDIEVEVDIVSAHRTPEKLFDYGKNAHTRGLSVIIAGAGGAAHLPGMVASLSPLPRKIQKFYRWLGFCSFDITNARWSSCGYCCIRWSNECWYFGCANYRRF